MKSVSSDLRASARRMRPVTLKDHMYKIIVIVNRDVGISLRDWTRDGLYFRIRTGINHKVKEEILK